MTNPSEVSISPEDLNLARTAPVIALDRRVADSDTHSWVQAPEIGWGDNFHVLARGIARYAVDPSSINVGSFEAVSAEGFLKWDGAESFIQENTDFLANFEVHFTATDVFDALHTVIKRYMFEAQPTGDWETADKKQALLEAALPHPDGLKAVWLRGAEDVKEPLSTLATLLREAGYQKSD